MIYETEQRDCLTCVGVTAGVERHAKHMLCIWDGISVAAADHNIAVFLVELLERIDYEALRVLAVVRILLVKVGVEVRAQCRDRHTTACHAQLIHSLSKRFENILEYRRRDGYQAGASKELQRRVIFALLRIAGVDGLYRIPAEREAVEQLVICRIREVEVGIDADTFLFCKLEQVKVSFIAAHDLFEAYFVRCRTPHSAVGKTVELEVDVSNSLFGKFRIHCLDVFKCSQRSLDDNGDTKHLLLSINCAESFDVDRNVVALFVLFGLGQLFDMTVAYQIISVRFCHADIAGFVVIRYVVFFGYFIIRQKHVTNTVVAGVLTF